ncbi:THAP domain-containing protein 4-like [Harpegnathos saltator]|uniref:THAP domain-containing protein 4-like n=1 Tax=Harpegnathos saltator TaxID=610380 RepID=UPI000DBEE38B|nr:THAP domain-containing protein 4-like [Harpegnathos saltator]
MVGCIIPFCNNSSEKGYILKIIPRDDERRRQWIERINTKYNWTPAKHSCVCEVHFQPEMWEQRSDKKRKLKHNAVPTIFEYFVKKQIPVTIPNTIEETQQPVYEEHIAVNEKQTVINDIVEPAPAPTTSLLNDTEHIEVNEKQMVINDTVEPAPVLTISSLP